MYITGAQQRGYRPGFDRWSIYKNIWRLHWPGFLAIYDERYRQRYGPLTSGKIAEVEKLLSCGDYRSGFVLHRCSDCDTSFVVPFTCKSRLCLSCYRKKLFGWSINLSAIMDPSFNHVHVTFTMPGDIILSQTAVKVNSRWTTAGTDP